MRICSLLPSNTEIVYALGLGDRLVAVTHECDYPPEATKKAIVTSSALPHDARRSIEIHNAVNYHLHQGSSIYHIDTDTLKRVSPDLILTQELCEVCAVSYSLVEKACRLLDGGPKIVSLEPNTLEDILINIQQVGRLTDREAEAQEVVAGLRRRIDKVASTAIQSAYKPRVFCLEWIDPPMAAGHWVPEMVSLAGGYDGLGKAGENTYTLSWEKVRDYAPEIIVVMPCGFSVARALEEREILTQMSWWGDLPAVKEGKVFVVDASSYFNRPGPRIVDGLEILGQIIHPELFSPAAPKEAVAKLA